VASVVSPYRMNPGYRRPRPNPGTDSDHGYSTMTPFGDQDSEIMSCLGDPNRDRRLRTRNPASLQSVTSGVSSRASSPQGHLEMETLHQESHPGVGERVRLVGESDVTVLPHQIIVAAVVHMVDN